MTARRWSAATLIALGATALASPAGAQEQRGYAANHFNPSERGSQWFVLDSVDIRGSGRLAFGMVNDYSYRSLVDYAHDGSAESSIVRNQYYVHLGGAVYLADRVRLGVDVPLQLFADGHGTTMNGFYHRAADGVAVGDMRVSADVRLLGARDDAARLAIGASLFVPSGSPEAYTGDGQPRVHPHVLFAGQIESFAYAATLGYLVRPRDEAFGDGYVGDAITGGVSAGVRLADGKVLLGPELFGSTVVADGRAFENRTTPVEALLGAHVDLGENLRLGAGAGVGLTRGYGAPVARGLLSLEWVPEEPTLAPAAPEATPVADRDGDGVSDCSDACGFAAGPASADPALNGCPPPPPPAPPPPPPPAPASVSPAAPADGDGDGVPDPVDACPDAAGAADPDPKKNGCPKAFLENGTIKITDQVKFKTASAEIVKGNQSEDVLGAVLAVVKAHPEIKKVHVEGYTDNVGNAAGNQKLSQARAESVMKWLVDHGVDASRLDAHGYGQDKPVDDNATEQGRTNNRRVEFHVEGSEK